MLEFCNCIEVFLNPSLPKFVSFPSIFFSLKSANDFFFVLLLICNDVNIGNNANIGNDVNVGIVRQHRQQRH